MNQFAEKCSHEAGCTEIVAEKVIQVFLECVGEELSQGNTVDLGSGVWRVFDTTERGTFSAEFPQDGQGQTV